MFPILTVVKPVAALVSSIGVGTVVGNATKAFIPVGASLITRASFAVGTIVVGAAAAGATEKYVTSQIDDIAMTVENIRTIAKTVKSA